MKRTIIGLLLVGLVHCAAYCWSLQGPHGLGYGCFDENCYFQSARRIAEGYPFSFSSGLPPTTGQTSVVYPFILAVPMMLGAEGETIRWVSLALACAFYLVFLLGWGVVISKLFEPGSFARTAAVSLVGLSGVCGYVAFSQCDQGLWMALSAVIAALLATGRGGWTVALLCLAPWVRPEGMMLVLAWSVVRVRTRDWKILLPVLSCAGVFALNMAMTGDAQFSSVSGKGYFKLWSFPDACLEMLKDALAIVGAYLCSVPVPLKRFFSVPSPVTSFCFWIGFCVLVRRWRTWRPEAIVFLLAAGMCISSTASGGFAGLDFDRYLAWMMPAALLVSAVGVGVASDWLRAPIVRKLPIVLVIVTTLYLSAAMVLMMRDTSARRAQHFIDFRAEARKIQPDATVGSFDFIWAYELPSSIRYLDLTGIFTPDFVGCTLIPAYAYETLKHRSELRFDYWSICLSEDEPDTSESRALRAHLFGSPVAEGAGPRYLNRADWSAYDRAAESPLTPRLHSARLDVGYLPDERAAHMKELSNCRRSRIRSLLVGQRASDGKMMVDAFQLVESGHEFILPVNPGRPATLVLRTIGEVGSDRKDANLPKHSYGDKVELDLSVNGRPAGRYEVPLDAKKFTDYAFEISSNLLTGPQATFRLVGTYSAFAYWLYQ